MQAVARTPARSRWRDGFRAVRRADADDPAARRRSAGGSRFCEGARAHLRPGALLALRDRHRARAVRLRRGRESRRRRAHVGRRGDCYSARPTAVPRRRAHDHDRARAADRLAARRRAASAAERRDRPSVARARRLRPREPRARRARPAAGCRGWRSPTTTEHAGSDGGGLPCLSSTPSSSGAALRVCALYPDLMNIYADRGNLLVLERRCAWRGIGFELAAQRPRRAARRRRPRPLLPRRRPGPRPAPVRRGPAATASARRCTRRRHEGRSCSACAAATSCSGAPTRSAAEEIAGVGLLDVHTVREAGPRLIGNVAIEVCRLDDRGRRARRRVLAGFENHGGRTVPRRRPGAARTRARGSRQRRSQRPRGRAQRQHDRHLPARPAAAEERVVRRLADRPGARASTPASSRRSTTARARGARGRPPRRRAVAGRRRSRGIRRRAPVRAP